MAHIKIQKYITLGNSSPLAATSYQIALDSEFTQIIDEIHMSEEFKLQWWSALPKIDGPGFYSDETALYARVKLFLRDDDGVLYAPGDWFVINEANQVEWNEQHRTITGAIN